MMFILAIVFIACNEFEQSKDDDDDDDDDKYKIQKLKANWTLDGMTAI